mgnify:CR=1 FL=1
MSAFICDNKTISVLAKAFESYGVEFRAEGYRPPVRVLVMVGEIEQEIGQELLKQNYASVNYRYEENTPVPKFEYEDLPINEGLVYGCLKCYDYQACETSDYETSEICGSLQRLENRLLERLLKKNDMVAPYGYDGHDILRY